MEFDTPIFDKIKGVCEGGFKIRKNLEAIPVYKNNLPFPGRIFPIPGFQNTEWYERCLLEANVWFNEQKDFLSFYGRCPLERTS
jgi:hypothetical protein